MFTIRKNTELGINFLQSLINNFAGQLRTSENRTFANRLGLQNMKRSQVDKIQNKVLKKKVKSKKKAWEVDDVEVIADPPQLKNEEVLGLEFLISPIDVKDFEKNVFEKHPLLVKRKNSSYYSDLFSTSDIKELLEFKGNLVLGEHLNIARAVDETREDWCPPDEEVLSPDMVWNAYEQGYTLQVFQPQQHSVRLARFMSRLEDEFGALCGANSYLTPKQSQGLAPHYDDVEVFILQIEGTKKWRLYYPPEGHELAEEYR